MSTDKTQLCCEYVQAEVKYTFLSTSLLSGNIASWSTVVYTAVKKTGEK